MKNNRLGYRGALSHMHKGRNLVGAALLAAICLGMSHASLGIISALVDIENHLEAWVAAYVISVMMTVLTIVLDALVAMLAWGIFAPFRRLLGVIARLMCVVYRFFVLLGHGMALVMGVVMVMRLAPAPAAALIIALHLGLTLAGYFGVRCMEKKLREELL